VISGVFALSHGYQESDIPVDRGRLLLTHLHTPDRELLSLSPARSASLGYIAQDRVECEFSWSCVSEVARSRFYHKCKEYSEPTSGLKPLTYPLYECAVSGCWALHRVAKPA
jgi:hypothetical protein